MEYDKFIKVFDFNKIVQMCDPFVRDCVVLSKETRGYISKRSGVDSPMDLYLTNGISIESHLKASDDLPLIDLNRDNVGEIIEHYRYPYEIEIWMSGGLHKILIVFFVHSWSCSSKCRDLTDMIVDVSFMDDPEFLDFVGDLFSEIYLAHFKLKNPFDR